MLNSPYKVFYFVFLLVMNLNIYLFNSNFNPLLVLSSYIDNLSCVFTVFCIKYLIRRVFLDTCSVLHYFTTLSVHYTRYCAFLYLENTLQTETSFFYISRQQSDVNRLNIIYCFICCEFCLSILDLAKNFLFRIFLLIHFIAFFKNYFFHIIKFVSY